MYVTGTAVKSRGGPASSAAAVVQVQVVGCGDGGCRTRSDPLLLLQLLYLHYYCRYSRRPTPPNVPLRDGVAERSSGATGVAVCAGAPKSRRWCVAGPRPVALSWRRGDRILSSAGLCRAATDSLMRVRGRAQYIAGGAARGTHRSVAVMVDGAIRRDEVSECVVRRVWCDECGATSVVQHHTERIQEPTGCFADATVAEPLLDHPQNYIYCGDDTEIEHRQYRRL